MKAALMTAYGDPDVLETGNLPDPEPGDGEVLLRVEAAGLNRLDHYLRQGDMTRDLALPHVLGSDAACVVERSGAGASRFSRGDRVIPLPGFPMLTEDADVSPLSFAGSYAPLGMARPGTYAQYITLPERWLVPDTTGLSPELVATLPMALTTGVRAVKTVGEVSRGQRVLVHSGASGTGSMNIQIARALGANVASTARSSEKAEFVKNLGADPVLDLAAPDFSEQVRAWAPAGVDVVIDNLGGDVLARSLGALRPGGILVAMGFVCGAEVKFNVQELFFGQVQIRGTLMGGMEDLEWGLRQVSSGGIKPNLDQVYSLRRAADAHRRLAAGKALGNIVMLPWE